MKHTLLSLRRRLTVALLLPAALVVVSLHASIARAQTEEPLSAKVTFLDGSSQEVQDAKFVGYWLAATDASANRAEPRALEPLGPPYHRTEFDYFLYEDPSSRGGTETRALYVRDISGINVSWLRDRDNVVPVSTKVVTLVDGQKLTFQPQTVLGIGRGVYRSATTTPSDIGGPIRRVNIEGVVVIGAQRRDFRAMLFASGILAPLQLQEAVAEVSLQRRDVAAAVGRATVAVVPGSPGLPATTAETFVLDIKTEVPHRIPAVSDGLWVSSIPVGMDVFVFPTSVQDQFPYFEKLARVESARPYQVGKTPVYLRVRPGEYSVVVVHPPLDNDPTYKQEWQERGVLRIPVNPFLGLNEGFAVEGRYFWTVERNVNIGSDLSTVIALFQRKDQPLTYLTAVVPKEPSFEFTMTDLLRDFSKLGVPGLKGGLPYDEAERAAELLRRGGVIGLKTLDDKDIVFEITGPNDSFIIHTQAPPPSLLPSAVPIQISLGRSILGGAGINAEPRSQATPNPTLKPLRVGGNIPTPRKIKDVAPVYPALARAAQIEGVVILEITISPEGKVVEAVVLRSIPLLDQAALDAVKQWEYEPTLVEGKPVPVVMTAIVNFRL